MFQKKPAMFEAEDRQSTSERVVTSDATLAAIARGRALQGLYMRQIFKAMFAAIGATLAPAYRAYRSRVELMKLDDRMLADIGISRAEAVAIAHGKRYEDESRRPREAEGERKLVAPAHFQPAH